MSTLLEEDSSEGLANFIQLPEMENEEKQNSLLNTLGTGGKKKHINSFLQFSTHCNERKKNRKGIRTEKDVKVSHRYPDYIHRKI